jgi:hypothetical protein
MRTWASAMLAAAVLVAWNAAPAEAGKAKGKKAGGPEQVFKKRDKDGDGQVTLKEFQGKKAKPKAEARFRKKDKDGNGKLTLAEFKGRAKNKKKKSS